MVERYGLILSGTDFLCYNAAVIALPPASDQASYHIIQKTDLRPEFANDLAAISLSKQHIEVLASWADGLPQPYYPLIGAMRSAFLRRTSREQQNLTRIACPQKGVEQVSRHGGFTPPLEIIGRTL